MAPLDADVRRMTLHFCKLRSGPRHDFPHYHKETKMLTFPNPKITKELMVADMIAHAQADELVQGAYGEYTPKFRGCAVGCSIHTINRVTGARLQTDDHDALSKALGIPRALLHLQDRIFEGLPLDDAKDWPRRFYAAVPKGVDLTRAVDRILVRVLREIALPSVTVDEWGVELAVEGVAAAIETGIGLEGAARAATAAARAVYAANAATAAARAVHAAVQAAAYAAARAATAAVHAFYAANVATAAARACAYTAAHTSRAAAYAAYAAYMKISDIICEEMEACGAHHPKQLHRAR